VTRGFRLPDRTYLPAIFERLAIGEQDQQEILAAWPSPERDREIWRSLERAYEVLVNDLGGLEVLRLPGAPAPSGARTPSAVESTPLERYFFVYVFLAALADVRRFHVKRRIPDDVSWATLSDLGRNLVRDRQLLGDGGLRTSGWLTLHFRGSIFELGRLQFNRMKVRAAHVADAFLEGAPALGIHIPESGPLTPESCDDSFAQAQLFFARHFPETPTRLGICNSWLLDPQLADYLEPESNIMRFQRRFTLVGEGHDGDADILRFVFHRLTPNIDDLPQRTTLERGIVAHLREGKHWRSPTGWLEL
jgi:GNAT domain-containint protein/N-acyltransferase family protein